MKFLDANILIYACFVPRSALTSKEKYLKAKSQAILQRVDEGETVAISVVHLSEVSNVLRRCFSGQDTAALLESLYTKLNVHILDVGQHDYLTAVHISKTTNVKINDCLATFLMKREHISEIYTFDQEFTKFKWIKVIRE